MMEGFGMHGWWGMGWWWIVGFMILILVVIWIMIANQRNRAGHRENRSALDILKDRYARGEIDREQYEEMKKDLL